MTTTEQFGYLGDLLRGGGRRLTGPRLAVYNVLVSAGGHMTAEEVADRARSRDPTVNLSSVYRCLSLFEELGIARESRLGEGNAAHWELAHPEEQFHLRCTSCGRVQHHSGSLVAPIEDHLSTEHGFTPTHVELVVSGLCDRCRPRSDA